MLGGTGRRCSRQRAGHGGAGCGQNRTDRFAGGSPRHRAEHGASFLAAALFGPPPRSRKPSRRSATTACRHQAGSVAAHLRAAIRSRPATVRRHRLHPQLWCCAACRTGPTAAAFYALNPHQASPDREVSGPSRSSAAAIVPILTLDEVERCWLCGDDGRRRPGARWRISDRAEEASRRWCAGAAFAAREGLSRNACAFTRQSSHMRIIEACRHRRTSHAPQLFGDPLDGGFTPKSVPHHDAARALLVQDPLGGAASVRSRRVRR